MVGIRKAKTLPNNITDDKIHYMLALPSADASAISTDFVRLLRPIYKPLSCHARISDGVTDYMITGALLVYRILLASLSAALNHCIGFAPIGMPFVADVPFISNSGDSNFPNTGCIFDTTSGVGGVFVMTK